MLHKRNNKERAFDQLNTGDMCVAVQTVPDTCAKLIACNAQIKASLPAQHPPTCRLKEKSHELGNHTVDPADFAAGWRYSDLAAQPKLGLCAERFVRRGRNCPGCIAFIRENMTSIDK